jgi:hypothetical protein
MSTFLFGPLIQEGSHHERLHATDNENLESKAERSEALNQAKFRCASLCTPIYRGESNVTKETEKDLYRFL